MTVSFVTNIILLYLLWMIVRWFYQIVLVFGMMLTWSPVDHDVTDAVSYDIAIIIDIQYYCCIHSMN